MGSLAGIFFILVAEFYLAYKSKEKRLCRQFTLNAIHGVLLFTLGAISTLLITEIGKHTIGRLRPHFIDACKPNLTNFDCFELIDGEKLPK